MRRSKGRREKENLKEMGGFKETQKRLKKRRWKWDTEEW